MPHASVVILVHCGLQRGHGQSPMVAGQSFVIGRGRHHNHEAPSHEFMIMKSSRLEFQADFDV